jgi:hypothetical protein
LAGFIFFPLYGRLSPYYISQALEKRYMEVVMKGESERKKGANMEGRRVLGVWQQGRGERSDFQCRLVSISRHSLLPKGEGGRRPDEGGNKCNSHHFPLTLALSLKGEGIVVAK